MSYTKHNVVLFDNSEQVNKTCSELLKNKNNAIKQYNLIEDSSEILNKDKLIIELYIKTLEKNIDLLTKSKKQNLIEYYKK